MVRIEMENGGVIDIELYEDKAPITAANFKKLVSEGFYDGLIFHRVIAGFMIQGGDPTGTGCGGSSENIKGEFLANGFNNEISHVRGVISMARSQSPNSASSQFFIMHADGKFLDGQYAAFGKVVSGMEVVDEIAGVKTDMRDRPIIDMRMKKAYII
ncbi:MAG: peptidylprolyl isomerase [Clostridia bacterium]|nr:peptidylprolyl isomerase [Clostridia bacterium]